MDTQHCACGVIQRAAALARCGRAGRTRFLAAGRRPVRAFVLFLSLQGPPWKATDDLTLCVADFDLGVLFQVFLGRRRFVGRVERVGSPEDNSPEGKVVEDVAAVSPDVGAPVFAQAFVVEAVDGGDLAGLVVASNKGHAIGVSNFEAQEQEEGFERVKATVDKVTCARTGSALSQQLACVLGGRMEATHEEVIGVWHVATDAKQLHQVMELAVYVAAYL